MIPSHRTHMENNSDSNIECIRLDVGSTARAGEASSQEVRDDQAFNEFIELYQWPGKSKNMISLANEAGYIPHIKEVGLTARENVVLKINKWLYNSKLERRVNHFVMFVIILDTVLLAFESTDPGVPTPAWVLVLSWMCLFVYFFEVGFRLYICSPTMAFFRKRFYVFDLLIVVLCTVMQMASVMSGLASIIRAIRLTRLLRMLRMLRLLRTFTRVMEMWHGYNMAKMENVGYQESVLSVKLRLNIGSFKLCKALAQQDYFQTTCGKDGVTVSGNRKQLGAQDLFTIAQLVKEEEDFDLFNFEEFCVEWLMLLLIWGSFIVGLSWAFVVLEADNYDLVIEENLGLKDLVDSALPVRDHMPDLLNTLANCEGNSSWKTYTLFDSIYQQYNSTNGTLWNELASFETPYTFMNPWNFEGSTFFTVAMITTIGYGTFTPSTDSGKLVVLFCSLPAIYLTIVFSQKNMELLQKGFCRTRYDSLGLMVFFSVIFFLSFMVVGGWVMKHSEGWTMWDAIYFCWVSFSTLGFGDYAPVAGENWNLVFLTLVVVGWNIVIFVIVVIEKATAELKNMNWWNEQHIPPPFNPENADRPRSSTVGVAEVIHKSTSNSQTISKIEELNEEINKCEDRLRRLKNEQKLLSWTEGSMTMSSSSDRVEDVTTFTPGIITMNDVQDQQDRSSSLEPVIFRRQTFAC